MQTSHHFLEEVSMNDSSMNDSNMSQYEKGSTYYGKWRIECLSKIPALLGVHLIIREDVNREQAALHALF